MSELIQKIVLSIFGENPILATIFIAMIPVIELRGAIPFGSSKEIWGDNALSIFEASVYSLVGSIISAIIIILLLIPVFNFLKKTKVFKRLVVSFEEKFKKQSDKIIEDAENKKYKSLIFYNFSDIFYLAFAPLYVLQLICRVNIRRGLGA